MILHFLGVLLVDAGLALLTAGLVSLARPLRFLRITSRRRGFVVLVAGVIVGAAGALLPAGQKAIQTPRTALDGFAPLYQFAERHEIRVAASPGPTFEAIRAVTAGEITLFRTLTTIRRFGRPGPEGVLDAPATQPILDVATQTTFMLLAFEPDREIVVGTLVATPPGSGLAAEPTPEWFRGLSAPGYAKATLNFVVEPEGDGSRVTTETRVFATDASTRRRFTLYWRLIYPGSALIRRMWLRAIRRRAEAAEPTASAGHHHAH